MRTPFGRLRLELNWKRLTSFDRLIFISIVFLTMAIAVLLYRGNQTSLKIEQFSWNNQKIDLWDREFSLTFNFPVDPTTVQNGLNFQPPLNGTISWSNQKLFYTLSEIPIYGITYQLRLNNVKSADHETTMPSFVGFFTTGDRAFAYLGTTPQEKGRLILYNITKREKTILTPADLSITEFRIAPRGEKILFLAYDIRANSQTAFSRQQLYTVSTGLKSRGVENVEPVGRLHTVLDSKQYTNSRFDLSENGQTLIVERENRQNSADAGLWLITEDGTKRPLGIPGGLFKLTPNGQKIAIQQNSGLTLLPLFPGAGTAQVLPGYEEVLDFSRDSSQALMVKNNLDYTRSLVLFDQKGNSKELFRSFYPITACRFEPRQEKTIYCAKTDLLQSPTGQFQEAHYLSVFKLDTRQEFPLISLPQATGLQINISPDGVALLFDQIIGNINPTLLPEESSVINSTLWLLPLPDLETRLKNNQPPAKVSLEQLYPGSQPTWLP